MENPASGARRRGSFRRSLGRVVVNFLMILFSVSCLYPVVWLCYASLNDKRDFTVNPVALPKAPSLANYFAIFSQSDMGIWMLIFSPGSIFGGIRRCTAIFFWAS